MLNRPSTRLLGAILLAALAAGLVAFLAQPRPEPLATGAFAVEVIGPGAAQIFNGTVEDANATALSVLLRAAAEGGFEVEVRGAGCPGAYVASVAGQGEAGAGGWVYQVAPAGGDFGPPPSVGAACCNLQPGDRVRWSWSEEGALGPPCP